MFNQELPIKRARSKEEVIKEWILIPLIEAYELVKKDITPKTYENKITWKIVYNVKHNSSISKEIYEKHIIDVSCRPKEDSDENTPNEPDIKFFISHICAFWIEAKRIYKNGTVSDYCGDGGLGCFLSGYYSKHEDNGCMIAYIQEGQLSDIQKEIMEKVNGCNCIELIEDIGIDNSFLSRHERAIHREIKIYHLLFDFVK